MSKAEKIWVVRPEYDGQVIAQSGEKQQLLSNELSQAELAEWAKDDAVKNFIVQKAIDKK